MSMPLSLSLSLALSVFSLLVNAPLSHDTAILQKCASDPAPHMQGTKFGQNMTPNASKEGKLDSFGAIFCSCFCLVRGGWGFKTIPLPTIPHMAQCLLCWPSTTPQKCDGLPLALCLTRTHLCDTPFAFCNLSHGSCAIGCRKKTSARESFTILLIQVLQDVKSIVAGPLSPSIAWTCVGNTLSLSHFLLLISFLPLSLSHTLFPHLFPSLSLFLSHYSLFSSGNPQPTAQICSEITLPNSLSFVRWFFHSFFLSLSLSFCSFCFTLSLSLSMSSWCGCQERPTPAQHKALQPALVFLQN